MASSSPPRVFVIGTLDTKGPEITFLTQELLIGAKRMGGAAAPPVALVDVSIRSLCSTSLAPPLPPFPFDPPVPIYSATEVLTSAGLALPGPGQLWQKAEAIGHVAAALVAFLGQRLRQGQLIGALAVGGSCGAALGAPALRSLPLGVPKLLLSTVASVDAASLAGSSDLLLLPSVADISGLNAVLRPILASAAAAMAGMAVSYQTRSQRGGTAQAQAEAPGQAPAAQAQQEGSDSRKPSVGLTMFGVTTPCVTRVQELLRERGVEGVVFHATGSGGRAMEGLIADGTLQGVLDITTTEVADMVVGGVLPCDNTRFNAVLKRGLPLVLSVGALDMVNFWAPESVPVKFRGRHLHRHNPQVTVMRTTPEECAASAEFISSKARLSQAPVRLLFPLKGVSALDSEGEPFFDPKANAALLNKLQELLHNPPLHQVIPLPYHINNPEFAAALVDTFLSVSPELADLEPSAATGAHTEAEQQEAEGAAAVTAASTAGKTPAPLLATKLGGHDRIQLVAERIAPHLASLRQMSADPVEIPGLAHRRRTILQHLRQQVAEGVPIIGGGAGTGISAKGEEAGGVDLIVIYNSGRFRMAGRGSLAGLLPFKDANAVVLEMAAEVLPVVKHVPVLAGVCATDPFRTIPHFLRELASLGFAGVQNFPTVGLFDGNFRRNLEETGMGFSLEVDMIAVASRMGFLTTPYAFDEEEARDMAAAGADVVVAHMGLTSAGSIGALTVLSLEQSVERVQRIADAARSVREDILVLCHGGPISGPSEAESILKRTHGVHGFYGASSMERLPVEKALVDNLKKYKQIQLK